MKCKRCGAEMPDAKRTCSECGAFLEGYTLNNVTGEYGYRGADGNFYESEEECLAAGRIIENMRQYKVQTPPVPIGYLELEKAMTRIPVFAHIGWFHRCMLRWCFGFRYIRRSERDG